MARLHRALAAFGCITAGLSAQTLEPPVLGRFFDPQSRTIREIAGVSGAASAGRQSAAARLGASAAFRPWSIADDGEKVQLVWANRNAAATLDAAPGVDRIVFSPAGDAAALIWRGSRVEVWTGFRETPYRMLNLPLDGMDGEISSIAVSDDAGAGLAIFEKSESARLFSFGVGGWRSFGDPGSWSAVAFQAGTRQAILANRGTNEISLISDLASGVPGAVLASGDDGVSAPYAAGISEDGSKLVAANGDGSLAIVEIATRRSTVINLERAADGVFAFAPGGVFRLSESPKPEIFLLDLSGPEPRVSAVPVAKGDN